MQFLSPPSSNPPQSLNIQMVKHQPCSDMFSLFCRTKHETAAASVWTNSPRQATFHHSDVPMFYDANNLQCPTESWLTIIFLPVRFISYRVQELQISHACYPPSVLTAAYDEARIAHTGRCLASWVFQTEEKYNRLLTSLPGYYSLTK